MHRRILSCGNDLKLSKLQAVQAALKSQKHDLHDRDHWNNQVARYRARLAICSIPGNSGMLQPVATPSVGQPTNKRQRNQDLEARLEYMPYGPQIHGELREMRGIIDDMHADLADHALTEGINLRAKDSMHRLRRPSQYAFYTEALMSDTIYPFLMESFATYHHMLSTWKLRCLTPYAFS